MEQKRYIETARMPIAYKLSLLMVSLLVVATVFEGWMIASQQAKLLEREIHKFGYGTTRQLVRQIKEPLLAQDGLALEQAIQSIVKDEGVVGVEIRTSDGTRIALSGSVPEALLPQVGEPVFWADNEGHGYISFIEMAYSNNLKVGEVVTTLDADVLSEVKSEVTRSIIFSTLLMIFIGILFSAWASKVVTKPIVRLIDISRRIADGDYQQRFRGKREDELGVLIESLNVMTDKLVEKMHVEQTFSRYVSARVAKEVLADLSPQELGGKEVQGSVLFADIVGFTAISEKMKAHEVSRLLNDYFSYVDQAAHQSNGHVDKYMGDCAMVVFGVPVVEEQHAIQAIYCALLIQGVVKRLNRQRIEQGEVTVEFHIGVNTGAMLAGNMGSSERMEYTVVGDTVNIASRLASASTHGEIIITEQVAQMEEISSRFNCVKGKSMKLKGKQEAITVFRVESGKDEIEERMARDIEIIFSNSALGGN